MQVRSLSTLVISLVSTATFACASGELTEGGSFTTANDSTGNDTNTTNTTVNDTDTGNDTNDTNDTNTTVSDTETDTGHAEETETGDPPPPDPTCDDGEQNQEESDVDCGGPNCDPCTEGQSCFEDSDCDTTSCVGGECVVPSCTDGAQNGDETDVDCGGPCDPCGDNQGCLTPDDCESMVCAGDICAPPNCGDMVQNGNETDLDCGGARCPGCNEGQMCGADLDCLSQYCLNGACAPADCQTNADCDEFDSACTSGTCNAQHTCDATPINNGSSCNDGDMCTYNEVCSQGACGGGAPVDCSGMSNACNTGTCNPQDGSCYAAPANNGNACNDNNTCTVGEVCNAGQCADPNAPGYVLYEDFSDNGAGWSLGPEWQIGAAAASNCGLSCPGNDPATDHTATNDNGVAGSIIGGCGGIGIHADYCLTSPPVNTANLATVWLTYWRHLHSDYPPYMTDSVAVFNGVGWTTIWQNGAACINDGAWAQQAHNITAYKAANMQVRFCYNINSGGVYTSGGWSLDDVVIGPAQCTP
jgi:hypothetical protein